MSAPDVSAPDVSAPGPAGLRWRWRRRRGSGEGRLAAALLAPAAVVVLGLVGWPVLRTVWLSVHDLQSPMPGALSPWVGAAHYAKALRDPDLWSAVVRTLYFTGASTLLEVGLGIGLGMLLHQRIRGRWLLRAAVVVPWALPTVVNGAMWRYILNPQFGPLNALLTQLGILSQYRSWLGQPWQALTMLVFADAWKNTSVVAFFVLAGLQTIPGELLEAAEMDGATAWRRFRSITLPLLRPMIVVVLVLRTIEAFKVFDLIFVTTRGGPANGTQTIALYAYSSAFADQDFGYGSAVSVLIVVVIMTLAVIYMRMLHRDQSGEPA